MTASWVLPAAGAAVFVGGHYLLLRAAAGKLPDGLAALCVEGTAALGLVAYVALSSEARRGGGPGALAGAGFACASGLCISVLTVLIFTALRRGGPVAATGTMVMGGGVTLSALLAPFLFAEPFTLRRGVGVALGALAMAVLASEG